MLYINIFLHNYQHCAHLLSCFLCRRYPPVNRSTETADAQRKVSAGVIRGFPADTELELRQVIAPGSGAECLQIPLSSAQRCTECKRTQGLKKNLSFRSAYSIVVINIFYYYYYF